MSDCWKKCSKFDQKSQNLKKCLRYPFGFPWNINWFQPLPDYWLTGKVIMCHDTIYFESLLWGIGHRITVFSWKFDICSFCFVGLCIARIALRTTKTPLIFKNFPGASPPSPHQGLRPWTPLGAAPPDPCSSPAERSARYAYLARFARKWALPTPPQVTYRNYGPVSRINV